MWSSVRDSWVISLSLLFRSAISLVRRSMWPSALLSAALLLLVISLVISCCILSMERIMSPNIFSHSCSALWAEFYTGNMEVCSKSTGCCTAFTSALRESIITPTWWIAVSVGSCFNFPFHLRWLVCSYLYNGWWWHKPWVSLLLVLAVPSAWVGHESSPGSQPGWRPAVAMGRTTKIVDADDGNQLNKNEII